MKAFKKVWKSKLPVKRKSFSSTLFVLQKPSGNCFLFTFFMLWYKSFNITCCYNSLELMLKGHFAVWEISFRLQKYARSTIMWHVFARHCIGVMSYLRLIAADRQLCHPLPESLHNSNELPEIDWDLTMMSFITQGVVIIFISYLKLEHLTLRVLANDVRTMVSQEKVCVRALPGMLQISCFLAIVRLSAVNPYGTATVLMAECTIKFKDDLR